MRKQNTIQLSLLFLATAAIISLIYYVYAPSVAPPTNQATLQELTIQIGERKRHYTLYTPKKLPENAALVFMLHGSNQSVADIRQFSGYQFEGLAEHHGFALVYPSAYQKHWNDCRKTASYSARTENIDDLDFIDAIRQQIHKRLHTSLGKTFVAGFSNGGQLAFRFALERPQSIAGIAVIAANLPSTNNMDCTATGAAVSVLMMNGSDDPINPYYGGHVSLFGFGARGDVNSAVTSAEYFANLAGYTGSPTEIKHFKNAEANDPTSSHYYAWRDRNRAEVILYTITGGGHVIPQARYQPPRLLGRRSTEINGPAEIWAFFARQLEKQM